MRKSYKKFLSVVLATSLVFGLTACGSKEEEQTNTNTTPTTTTAPSTSGNESGSNSGTQGTQTTEITKPEKITVMFDGTVFTKENGRDEFEKAWEAATGIDMVIIQPDHSTYYDNVSQTFASDDWPDVVLLGAAYYAGYATNGTLWDMSSAWENSELKASGRIINPGLMDSLYINGGLYGFAPASGNGCVTYIKKSWMDNVGITKVPSTYDEYIALLDAFTNGDPDGNGINGDTYALTAAGIISKEVPWTNYLPEFYQDAYPDFYQKEDGTWVDGFTEQAMIDALERLTDAYDEGYIDMEVVTNETSDCRNKFYDDKCGVFTYWAGTWAYNLSSNLIAKGHDGELVTMPPIAELGTYMERQTPVWCITSKCENPEGVFKYFMETMLDGGTVQTLWTYGVENVHYSTKAETIVLGEGEKAKTYTYTEGQFHMLENIEKGGSFYKKNHIDPMLSIALFANGDPGEGTVDPIARESQNTFYTYSKLAPAITSNEVLNQHSSTITALRRQLVAEVVTQGKSVEDAMAQYKAEVGDKVAAVLESLNK